MLFDSEKLKRLFPYIGPVLVFLGVLRLHLYYTAFNIKIVSFLDFPEILTAFLDDLIYLTFLGAIMLVAVFFSTKKFESAKTDFRQSFLAEPSFVKRLSMFLKWVRGLVFFFNVPFLSILIVQLIRKENPSTTLWSLFWSNSGILLVYFHNEFRYRYLARYEKLGDPWLWNLLLFSLLLLSSLFQRVQSEIRLVKDSKKFSKVSFNFEDSIVKSDSIAYYIGNTTNYLFYYDQQKQTTTVFQMSKVSKITFPE